MSAYPNQRRGWPEQPPLSARRRGRPGRRRRGWIALAAVVIVLAVAFVIGDQAARSAAQNMIAAKFHSEGLSVKPGVSIKGWPFLTQLAARDVRTIDISASDFTQDRLDISSMNATASGVRINSSFNGATIGSLTGTIDVTYSSVASALDVTGLTIVADPSKGPDVAKVSDGPFSTTARVSVAGPYKIGIQLQDIQGLQDLEVLPVQIPPSFTLNLPHFPAGIRLSGVSLTARGLQADIAARDTTLSQ